MIWSYYVRGCCCMYNKRSRGYILPPILDWGVWRGMPLEVVCNNHSPAPIYVLNLGHLLYGGYLPWTGVYCGAWSAPSAVSACCTCHMCWLYVTWVLACTWCKRRVALVEFPSPLELWDIYVYYGTCKHRPATNLIRMLRNHTVYVHFFI